MVAVLLLFTHHWFNTDYQPKICQKLILIWKRRSKKTTSVYPPCITMIRSLCFYERKSKINAWITSWCSIPKNIAHIFSKAFLVLSNCIMYMCTDSASQNVHLVNIGRWLHYLSASPSSVDWQDAHPRHLNYIIEMWTNILMWNKSCNRSRCEIRCVSASASASAPHIHVYSRLHSYTHYVYSWAVYVAYQRFLIELGERRWSSQWILAKIGFSSI